MVFQSVFASATPDEKLGFDSRQLVEDPAGFFGAEEWGPGLALGFIPLITFKREEKRHMKYFTKPSLDQIEALLCIVIMVILLACDLPGI